MGGDQARAARRAHRDAGDGAEAVVAQRRAAFRIATDQAVGAAGGAGFAELAGLVLAVGAGGQKQQREDANPHDPGRLACGAQRDIGQVALWRAAPQFVPLMAWLLLAVQIWIAHESEKVRPDARPPSISTQPRIRLAAAGGECAGAQIAVRGPAQELRAASRLDLYRVATISLRHPSGPDGAAVSL